MAESLDEDVISALNATDTVEGTVFSKSWVLSLLVQLVKHVKTNDNASTEENSKCSEGVENDSSNINKTVSTWIGYSDKLPEHCETENRQLPNDSVNTTSSLKESPTAADGTNNNNSSADIDENLENDLCKLWDSSTNIVGDPKRWNTNKLYN